MQQVRRQGEPGLSPPGPKVSHRREAGGVVQGARLDADQGAVGAVVMEDPHAAVEAEVPATRCAAGGRPLPGA